VHKKYKEVIKLRFKGKSYREIAKILGVSKNSVSRWCKNLRLPLAIQKIIEAKTRATRIQLVTYNRQKHQRVQAENKKIRKKALKQIQPLSKRELLLIGAALYWAEGYKKQEHYPTPRVSFVNSDPDMIRLFARFLRKTLRVPEEKFRLDLRVHPNINRKKAINFWSKVTNISSERFSVSHQISRLSQGKRPKNSLPYGTLKLTINGRQKFYQIKGWIDGLIKQAVLNNSKRPVP